MTESSEQDLLRQVLIDYLKGERLAVVEDAIRKHVQGEKSGYNLYNKIYAYGKRDRPEETHALTIEFLRLLEIDAETDEKEFKLLVSLNLYQMLTRLKGRHGHLDKLIEIIHQVHEPQSWTKTIIVIILACTGIGVFLYFYPHLFWLFVDWLALVFPKIFYWLCELSTEVRSVAIIGMTWQSWILIYTWYKTFRHGTNPSPDSLRSLAFKTLGITMNISGNVLMYLAHGALGPVAAILFIACSLMDVLETIYLLFIKYENPQIDLKESILNAKLTYAHRRYLGVTTPSTTEQLARKIRLENMRERDLNILWVKLAATALITISIILWCTLPSGIILSLCFLIFGLLVNLAKDLIIKRMTNQYAESLQTGLRIVYKKDSKVIELAKNEFARYAMQEKKECLHNPAISKLLDERWAELSTPLDFDLGAAKKAFQQSKKDFMAIADTLPQPWADTGLSIFSNNRPLRKLTDASEIRHQAGAKNRSVHVVHEDSSTDLVPNFTDSVEFPKRSNSETKSSADSDVTQITAARGSNG